MTIRAKKKTFAYKNKEINKEIKQHAHITSYKKYYIVDLNSIAPSNPSIKLRQVQLSRECKHGLSIIDPDPKLPNLVLRLHTPHQPLLSFFKIFQIT